MWASLYTSLVAWLGRSTALRRVMSVVIWQKSRLMCGHGAPGIAGLQSRRIVSRSGSTYLSKHGLSAADSCGRSFASHDATSGFHPSSVSDT